jgi:hypothetical protein
MSEERKELIGSIVFSFILGILLCVGLWYGTSTECWYAEEHDSQCENVMADETKDCGCYNRFIEKSK